MILKELAPENITLNNHQKYILLSIQLAETPTLAFEAINNDEADYQARNILKNLGFLTLQENQAFLTEKGENALKSYGLIDEMNEPTEIGRELLNDFSENDA